MFRINMPSLFLNQATGGENVLECASLGLCLIRTITSGEKSGIILSAVVRGDPLLCSGKYYKPEMSEDAELLKAWKEE